jgi:hypothetical protein
LEDPTTLTLRLPVVTVVLIRALSAPNTPVTDKDFTVSIADQSMVLVPTCAHVPA